MNQEHHILALQDKLDMTYEEAEIALKQGDGNVELAYELVMKQRNSLINKTIGYLKDRIGYKLIIQRKNQVLINIPLLFLLMFIPFIVHTPGSWLLAGLFMTFMFMGCDMLIVPPSTQLKKFMEDDMCPLKLVSDKEVELERERKILLQHTSDGFNEIVVD